MFPKVINESCSLTSGTETYAVSLFFHSSRPPKDMYSTLKDDPANQSDYFYNQQKIRIRSTKT